VRKQTTLVLVLLLAFAGGASAAAVAHTFSPARQAASAIRLEKRLGPKPTPRWYWRWAEWRLGEGYAKGRALEASLRPKQAPHRIPGWAWRRLHFFLLARWERRLSDQAAQRGRGRHGTTTTTTGTTTTTSTTTTAGTTTTTAASSGGGAGIGLLSYGGHLSSFSDLSQYRLVVGDAWDSDAAVLASVPGLGLAYFSGTDVNTSFSTGVPYAQALANGWLLTDASGNLLVNRTYPSNYVGDIGSAAYQQAWIANVEQYLAAHPGIDGVFIDDVLYDPKALCGTYPAKYPTTSAWAAAEVSFVKAVYAALHAKGYYVALNAGAYVSGDPTYDDGSSTISWWKQVGPYADGLMDEYYAETSNGTNQLRASGSAWYQQWDGWQRLIGVAQSMGDDFLGLEYNGATNTAAMTYGKASFLLEWNGGGSVFLYNAGASDPANGAWTTDIGTPAGPKQQVGVGWERPYTAGTVLVNPSPTASQTFTVGGTTYTLGPTSARILPSS